jgi:acetoacetyl-CoA synthetase
MISSQSNRTVVPRLRLFRDWVAQDRGVDLPDYAALWRWSVDDPSGFWASIWGYCEVQSPSGHGEVLRGTMPEATWFEGAQVNYARQILRHVASGAEAGQPAIISEDEAGSVQTIGWAELRRRVASLALTLRDAGVRRGDRVAAYLPNCPDAVVALLACASLGAVWSLCSPDMGTSAVLDRFKQIGPRVLIGVDAVRHGGRRHERADVVAEIRKGLPSVVALLLLRTSPANGGGSDVVDLAAAQARDDDAVATFEPEWLPFDHPLWILYSSGTTGLPKAIVHGHGGVILAGCVGNLHMDIGASYASDALGERLHWYSATGWVMWNVQVGALLSGTTICLYDGAPRGTGAVADWLCLWSFAARHRVTWFGGGAAFFSSCRKADLSLADAGDLRAVRALGTTGSPLPAAVELWGTAQFAAIGSPDVWWCNLSGGTDIAAAFLSGNRELPATPGRIQCRHLGAAVEAWDDAGAPVIGAVGELVCTRPFPSMPLFLWGDTDGSRYRSTYFDRWPGVWQHGDWLLIEEDGSCTISGRSDATINRHGLRMGTAEIYAAVEHLPAISDTLVIDVETGTGDTRLVMFVVPASEVALDGTLGEAIGGAIRSKLSPRFVPDHLILAPAILRTLSGKRQELPVKRLFTGWDAAKVLDPNVIENPEAIPWYVETAAAWRAGTDLPFIAAGPSLASHRSDTIKRTPR